MITYNFEENLPIIDSLIEILKRIQYDKNIIINIPDHKQAVGNILNLLVIITTFYPSYCISVFGKKLLRKKINNKIFFDVRINNKIKLKNNNEILYDYANLNFLDSRIKVRGRVLNKYWNEISKNKFLDEIVKELSEKYDISTTETPFILFKNEKLSFSLPLIFFDKNFEGKIGGNKVYFISKYKNFVLPKFKNFFFNFLSTYFIKKSTLYAIDLIIEKENINEIFRKFSNVDSFKNEIEKSKERFFYVLVGLIENKDLHEIIRNNHIFCIPNGYEDLFLKDILRSIFYFVNKKSDDLEKIVDFYNKKIKEKQLNLKFVTKEDFYKI